MKACQNCGAQMPDDLLFCTHCGSPLQEANYPGQQYQQQYPKPGGVFESNNLAVAALAFGLVGLLLTLAAPFLPGISSVVGIVLCIVGIVLSVKARNVTPVGAPGRGMATGGLVCSIIGIVIGVIAACIVCVCTCALCTVAGAEAGSTDFSDYLRELPEILDVIVMR